MALKYSYSTKRILGTGAFAQVFLGSAQTQEGTILHKVAVKRIEKSKLVSNPKAQTLIKNEIVILQLLKVHPHIVVLKDYYEDQDYTHLVLEYCDAGDLAAYLKLHTVLQEPMIQNFIMQLASGVQYMRSLSIVHRDLKPQNIMLQYSSQEKFDVMLKITDFGFAIRMTTQDLTKTFCGSPLHMAPEVLAGHNYDPKIDLWSLGTIAYQMGTGTTPYRAQNLQDLRQKLVQAEQYQRALLFPGHLSDLYKNLVQHLLRINPHQRISFDEFFQHPFLHPLSNSPEFFSTVEQVPVAWHRSCMPPPHYVVIDQPLTALEEWLDTHDSLIMGQDDLDQVHLRQKIETALHQVRLLLVIESEKNIYEHCIYILRHVDMSECLSTLHGVAPSRDTLKTAIKFQDCLKYCLMQWEGRSQPEQISTELNSSALITLVAHYLQTLLRRLDLLILKNQRCSAQTMYETALCLTTMVPVDANIKTQLLTLHQRMRTMPILTFGQVGVSMLKNDSHHLNGSMEDTPRLPSSAPINIPPNSLLAKPSFIQSGSAPSNLVQSSSFRFCGSCGTQFLRGYEKYCVMCGTPRGSI